jgi:hypothetical protein
MNDQIERERLEDVFDAYVASEAGPNSASLAEWIHRYPEYARELTAFAASWSLMTWLPPSPDAEEVDEETLVLRGMSVIQNLLHRKEQERAPAAIGAVAPIASLLEEGRARGLGPRQLAQAADLGDISLRKLDRRLIRFGSIPREAIEGLAGAIHRGADSVAQYLQQGPTFAAAARHRAEQAPQLAEPEDFFDAVRNDPTMSDEQRARWVALAPPENR